VSALAVLSVVGVVSEVEKEREPDNAGALPFGVICKLKARESTLALPLSVSVTGMLKAPPGVPDAAAAETVP